MSSIAKIYTSAVRSNLKPLFGNWQPSQPVSLGDYGILRDDTFICLGNIKDLGIVITEEQSERTDHQYFASKSGAEVSFSAKGSPLPGGAVDVNASMSVAFSSSEAVFFSAAECRYSMVKDKVALGAQVIERSHKHTWKREWVVVTDRVDAGSATIVVSGGDSASITFDATGDVAQIDLAKASIGLSVRTAKNIGYQVVAEKGLTPLLGLCQIQSTFLWMGEKFSPLSASFLDNRMVDAMEGAPQIRTEGTPDALYFGQLW